MNWLERYKAKLRTAEEAVRVISSGQRVYVHPGCAVPEILVNAMCDRKNELVDVEVIHLLTVGHTRYPKWWGISVTTPSSSARTSAKP
jgi:acyl-CoA hydrolase